VLRELGPTRVIVDVGGVGYEVHIPLSTFAELPDAGKLVSLHVYTHAREGALQLFGFHTRGEHAAFDLLLRASRVGPKLAQAVLSGLSPADLLDAIQQGRVGVLRAAPGIGTRTAERILVELRDRTGELMAALAQEGGAAVGGRGRPVSARDGDRREQSLSALMNLGYPKPQAERALDAALVESGEDSAIEDLVRGALRSLAK
jgi:Holliday junction DNA helicase RuvA